MIASPLPLAFGFGNLFMLGWLAAAAVPIVIHLWNKRRYREVSWAAIEYLLDIGVEGILEHDRRLAGQLLDGLARLGGEIITPSNDSLRAGIATARFPGRDAVHFAARLAAEGVHVSPRLGGLRYSAHFYNDDTDIDRALAVTTLLTVLSRLEKKGFVASDRSARPHRYTAVASRADHVAELMHSVLGDAGDRTAVLERFVGGVSAEDAAVLRQLLGRSG